MYRRVGLLLFTAGWAANHFSTLLVVYRRDLGLAPAALGILFGAYALGLVPGLVLAGRASDRRGRRALVLPALSPSEAVARRATLALSAGFGLGPVASGLLAEFAPAPMVLPYVVHGLA